MGAGFLTVHANDIDWEDDHDTLALGKGVQIKVLYEDVDSQHVDMLVKFPPGYYEPEHAHDSSHSICVLEGVQIVGGEHMRPGDYVWADSNVVHGPYDYPEGCVVFVSFRGVSAAHRYPGSSAGDITARDTANPERIGG